MKYLIASLALLFIVAGCTLPGGTRIGTDYGMCLKGQFDDGRFDGTACPTVVPDGSSPMGSRVNNPDGSVDEDMYSTIVGADGSSATGPAANKVAETGRLEALLLICAVAPDSNACLGG